MIWEVYAGLGRITRTANRRSNVRGERFGLADGWNFDKAAHRRTFLRRLREERPDAVIWAPVCTLWSNLQELSTAVNPSRQAVLDAKRQDHHRDHLTFVAIGYEHQRREGRIALVEHPYSSKAWQTDAFQSMKGYDVTIDMCEYGLQLPDDEGHIKAVKKPTNLRVTHPVLFRRLSRRCRGDHEHTPLEGYAQGLGRRSTLAENFTQEFATQVVTGILAAIDSDEAIQALEDVPEPEQQVVAADGDEPSQMSP